MSHPTLPPLQNFVFVHIDRLFWIPFTVGLMKGTLLQLVTV
jgi:hypothetical protein